MNNEQGKQQQMKAIETIYAGYRFRSRLEARWAVFFDTLDIRWEYEKEGYVLPDGTWYLPDFWLPDQDCWYEVKGGYADTGAMWDYWARLFDFAQQSQKQVYIARGEIRVPHVGACPGYDYPSTIDFFDPVLSLDDPRRCYPDRKFPEPFYTWVQCRERFSLSRVSDRQVITPKIIAAYTAARQARFEHGERG